MYSQTPASIAIGVLALTMLLVVLVVIRRFRIPSDASLAVKLGLSSCFLLMAGLAWSLCYMGFVSGVMMSITRHREIANDFTTQPARYWIAIGFAYALGLFCFSVGVVLLFARRSKR